MAAQSRRQPDRGVADALRAAIDRTLSVAGTPARAGAPGISRERATQLLDEVAKLGHDAREELARRGQGAAEELAQRLEAFERRLAVLEDALRKPARETKPKAEG